MTTSRRVRQLTLEIRRNRKSRNLSGFCFSYLYKAMIVISASLKTYWVWCLWKTQPRFIYIFRETINYIYITIGAPSTTGKNNSLVPSLANVFGDYGNDVITLHCFLLKQNLCSKSLQRICDQSCYASSQFCWW